MSVRITGAPTAVGLPLSNPEVVARAAFADPIGAGRHYDVSRDGQKFLVLKDAASAPKLEPQITAVLNWTEELKSKLAVK